MTVATIPAPAFAIETYRLDNGLRVVLAPDPGAPVVGVAVVYDVGMRSEPEGRTGFAHLFEHMMFQGSHNVGKAEHMRHVQSAGGTFNGSTHIDYTDYFNLLPSNGLELALFLESDRMRGPAITEENLENQVSVVKEEIRVNVLNRPYGGFPWLKLPPVMFDTFPNAHDGYGSFGDLEAATVADAQAFFDAFYPASNAVLSVAGDFQLDTARELVQRHFGDVESRPAPVLPSFNEPDLDGERRESYADERATLPAVAMAWRTPDPVTEMDEFLPYVVLGELLTDGDASRLVERLVHQDRTATAVAAHATFMAEPFASRGPTALLIQAFLPPATDVDGLLATVDAELARVAEGVDEAELDRVKARVAAQLLRGDDSVMGRSRRLATAEIFHGDARVATRFAALLGEVTAESVAGAAASMTPQRRAILEVVPGGEQ
ncbi:M16 family metallopeptidase [Glycomyces buryatensis]|uniref:Insulinase family protein n=1 Tax=Glycomyces buryatensis TaxID=2570927 RepID=A0A4V4HSS2_9ACTN|nr:pitrilysin family protein [Glycomyces buryatensis]THV42116.1 insulinase family protein [Glycomyces buryatensis]